jgi:hypothetical protein
MSDVNYGPLAELIGIWEGDKGMDIAPEPDGKEENPYYERIEALAGGDLKNAQTQVLSVVHYRKLVTRKSTNEVFHDQCGYWMWDAKENVIMHAFVIPRAVSVLAGANYTENKTVDGRLIIDINSSIDNKDWGIVQSPFMKNNAKTISFHQYVKVGNGKFFYKETTMLDIYGKPFEHTDENELIRVG